MKRHTPIGRRPVPKVVTYKRTDGDHAWRAEVRKEPLAGSTEGYRRRIDMREGLWLTLEAVLRWAMNRDKVRALLLVGMVQAGATEAADVSTEGM